MLPAGSAPNMRMTGRAYQLTFRPDYGMLKSGCGREQRSAMEHVLSGFLCNARSRHAVEAGFAEMVLQRAQRKRARPTEQRDVVVTAFPALPAGTPIQLTAMSIGEGPVHP